MSPATIGLPAARDAMSPDFAACCAARDRRGLTTAPAAAAAAADRKRRHRRGDDDAMETDGARGGSEARWEGDGEKTHVGPLLPRTRPPLVFSLIFLLPVGAGWRGELRAEGRGQEGGRATYTLSSLGNSPVRLLLVGDPIVVQHQAFACNSYIVQCTLMNEICAPSLLHSARSQ